MARRSGFFAALERAGREAARQQRLAEAERRKQAREQLRYQCEQLRLKAHLDKAHRQQYLVNRAREAEDMTSEVQATVESLQDILEASLKVDNTVSFESLRLEEKTTPFCPTADLAIPKTPPKKEDFTMRVKPMTFIEKLISARSRYGRELADAEARFAEALNGFRVSEEERMKTLPRLQAYHEQANLKRLAEIRQRNAEVDELARAYQAGEPHAVKAYCSIVLDRSQYPEGFSQALRLAYVPDPKELVIDYELPTSDVVPRVAEFRYVKAKDSIEEKPRKAAEFKEAYQDIVAAVALRTIHEVLEADQGNHLAVVVFNGFVSTVDPATGLSFQSKLESRGRSEGDSQVLEHRNPSIIWGSDKRSYFPERNYLGPAFARAVGDGKTGFLASVGLALRSGFRP